MFISLFEAQQRQIQKMLYMNLTLLKFCDQNTNINHLVAFPRKAFNLYWYKYIRCSLETKFGKKQNAHI